MRILLLSILLLCDSAWGQLYDPTTSEWTQVMDNQDDAVVGLTLNHSFSLYGETFTDVWFSTNGFITFYDKVNDPTAQSPGGVYLPDPVGDDKWSYMLAPLWADLRDGDNGDGSGFFYQLEQSSSTFYWHDVTEDDSYATQNNGYTSTGNTNDFALVIYDDNSFDFMYDDVNFVTQGFFMGTTGDATYNTQEEDEQGSYSFYREVSSVGMFTPVYDSNNNTYNATVNISNFGTYSAASDGDGDGTYNIYFNEQPSMQLDCSDPLSSSSCPGYHATYFDQQCTADPLYDSQCNGYQAAYYDQECSNNPLYDSGCPGYASANFEQQCTDNPLYNEECSGYQAAYDLQQCNEDASYSTDCSGYAQAFIDDQCDLDPTYSPYCPGYNDAITAMGIDDMFYGEAPTYDDVMYLGATYDDTIDYTKGDDGNYKDDPYSTYYDDPYAGNMDNPYMDHSNNELSTSGILSVEYGYFDSTYGDPYSDVSYSDPYSTDSFDFKMDDKSMTLAGAPLTGDYHIEDDFYAGVLPPGPELDAIFMDPDEFERLTPEEKEAKIDELDAAFEEFEEEMMIMEREFLEENPELIDEFYDEGEYMLYEEPPPMTEEEFKKNAPEGAPMHHEENFEPEEFFLEERDLERTDVDIIIHEEQSSENEPSQTKSGERASSANVSIALQASETAVRQAVEVGANLSSAEVIAIDAGQVDTAQAIDYGQQQDDGQAETDSGNSHVEIAGHHEEQSIHVAEVDFDTESVIEEQQQDDGQVDESTFDTSSDLVIDEQFGDQMTQSFATGGNIGTFLSGQSPDFQRFDVKPPEYDVQRDINVVESSVSNMSSQDISRQAERLAEQAQEGGGFENDQTIAVTVIGYVPGFETYRQDVVSNGREFYRPETVYGEQKNIDDNRTMLFMTQQGDQRHTEMVADQYRR